MNLEQKSLLNRSLPTFDGKVIVSPKYTPPGHKSLEAWRAYCKSTPKSQWPEWLVSDIATMKRK